MTDKTIINDVDVGWRDIKFSYSMRADLEQYPRFFFDELTRCILPEHKMSERNSFIFQNYQRHHFIEKSMRKSNLADYSRFEHLQKLIFIPAQMNYDLSSGMGENLFFEKWGAFKYDLVFNKDKWLENYYD